MRRDTRARINYVDVIMTVATLVALMATLPWWTDIVDLIQSEADPLTSTLAGLVIPLVIIGLILSMGVSARSG